MSIKADLHRRGLSMLCFCSASANQKYWRGALSFSLVTISFVSMLFFEILATMSVLI
jgi:hypothetical protein